MRLCVCASGVQGKGVGRGWTPLCLCLRIGVWIAGAEVHSRMR
jgi:hypothetical protein